MSFASLQAQENRLVSLQSNLSSYKAQLSKQEKRKSDIESIIREIKGVCNNKTDDINSYLNKMLNTYDDATKGITSTPQLYSTTSSDKEKDFSSDGNMSNALSQIQSELNDVNRKINELKTNINNTSSQITSCQSAIRAERYNIANDYRNQYNYAQSRMRAAESAYKSNPSSAQLKQKYQKACRDCDAAKYNFNKYRSWL